MSRTIAGSLVGPDGTALAGTLTLTAKTSTPGAAGVAETASFDIALVAGAYSDEIELGNYLVDFLETGQDESVRLGEASIDAGASVDLLTLIDASASPRSSTLGIAYGGTGATTQLGAQQALGVEVGVDVEAYTGTRLGKVSEDTSLAALIADIGATVTHLHLYPEAWPVAADLTIPSTITLKLQGGVDIQVANGKTLTLNCDIQAGLYQIFSGDGDVAGISQIAFPQWFGGKPGDDTFDNAAPITKCIAAAETTLLTAGTWYIQTSITYLANKTLAGVGKNVSEILMNVASDRAIELSNADSQATLYGDIRDLEVNLHVDHIKSAGSVGLYLRHGSYITLSRILVRNFETDIIVGETDAGAVAGGYYNSLYDCELANATYGIWAEEASNGLKIIGGRIQSNDTGIYLQESNDVLISTTLEKNNTGFDLVTCSSVTVLASRFESNGKGAGGAGSIDLVTGSGGRIRSDCNYCNVISPHCSSNSDQIINESLTSVVIGTASGLGASGGHASNYFGNAALDEDSDANGVADGLNYPVTAGITYTIDAANKVIGDGSQKVAVAPAATRRDGVVVFQTIIGNVYSVAVRFKTDTNAGWNLRIGESAADSTHLNLPIYEKPGFDVIGGTFVATTTDTYITFWMATATATNGGNLWIDALVVCEGPEATFAGGRSNIAFDVCTTATRPTVSSTSFPPGLTRYDATIDQPIVARDGGVWESMAVSDGTTGGTGSAGAGKQYVEQTIEGVKYKMLHDGII